MSFLGVVTRLRHPAARIDQPAVALTDFGLALETGLLALDLARQTGRGGPLARWGAAFFGSAAVASLAGGADHGFCRRPGRERAHDALWTTSLLAIGASSLSLVGIAAELGLDRTAARRVMLGAAVAAGGYALAVLAGRRAFALGLLASSPAALLLLAVLVRRWHALRGRASATGIAAVLIAFLAAGVQRLEIDLNRPPIDHDTGYHLIQSVAFALLFLALRDLTDEREAPHAHFT